MAKTYIEGTSCKAVQWQFGEFYNISINLEKLQQYANEKGYVNMTMSKRREVWQYWDTHYFTLNEWSPEWGNWWSGSNQQQNNNQAQNNQWWDNISVEDIPF